MKHKTNWKVLEECRDDYKVYFRFIGHEGKPVKIFICSKDIPSNESEAGYFNKNSARQLKGV